ncbi:MAG: N-acetylneuraminate synthase family protein [Proteobacteria bacterium]|nr:N-acetylneuraminate synthase family protein [Pseudomonadota bacterium]
MKTYAESFFIGEARVSQTDPTYFIADIAANHDGDLNRAKDLIWLAKEAGADCAKFQHFEASKIVSDFGFQDQALAKGHQAAWEKSVYQVYDQYHTKKEWTDDLIQECKKADIAFMTTPYDLEAIEQFAPLVPAFKIGSGDITYHQALKHAASQVKPILLATGASTMEDVIAAVDCVLSLNSELCLMQCNTNYTGDIENFRYVNLSVLNTFANRWPGLPLGLSDHTPGHSAVLGAITLGARVIEKHFTDDNARTGPDHAFALNPTTWSEMVNASRELEMALGDGVKRVEANEAETVIIQRRALRTNKPLSAGTRLTAADIIALRPCKVGECQPFNLDQVIGKRLLRATSKGEALRWDLIE